MAKRERIALIEAQPSQVLLLKHGRRTTEKLLLEGGLNVMTNLDGTITMEIHNGDRSIVLRMSPADVKGQSHIFRGWRNLR